MCTQDCIITARDLEHIPGRCVDSVSPVSICLFTHTSFVPFSNCIIMPNRLSTVILGIYVGSLKFLYQCGQDHSKAAFFLLKKKEIEIFHYVTIEVPYQVILFSQVLETSKCILQCGNLCKWIFLPISRNTISI